MPDRLLTEEEKLERTELPYPEILKYAYFFEKAGWDKATVDRQEIGYTNDLIIRQSMRNEADGLIRRRIKSGDFPDDEDENDDGSEDSGTRGRSLSDVRALFKTAGNNIDDWPDDAVKQLIGRT